MARNGSVNFDDLDQLRNRLKNNISEYQIRLFIESCAKELAARLLAKVIKRTPVGVYTNRVGGTLRRGWTANKSQAASAYVNNLKVNHFGDQFVIEIVNPVEYASYVEYGHRTRNHKGWVEGKFMLTISSQELQQATPGILEKKLQKKLGEVFG